MENSCENSINQKTVFNFNDASPKSLPRPRPQFFTEESVTFSTKKEKRTPRTIVPPRPPVKSCPPVSRLRPIRKPENEGPRVVSFVNNDINNSIMFSSETNFENTNSDSNTTEKPKKNLYFEQSFQIEEFLGCGSFGKVYKVKSKDDGKYYAVKKSKEKYKGVSDRRRKLEEVAKHEELPPHPNLVKFFRAWEEKQKLYIQIELCQMSLSTYAEKNHDIPEDTIWKFLIDLLHAVKHLHDRDLVHMDIKPDNIFISFDGVCKLGDFGLVIDLKKDDLKEVQEGDPKYLAPEVLKGYQYITTAVDIFSLGMSILELATDLDLPRGGETWHQLREGQIPDHIVESISTELIQIIYMMIDPDHKRRATADELLKNISIRKKICHENGQYLIIKSLTRRVKQSISFFYQIFRRVKIGLNHGLAVVCSFFVNKFEGMKIFCRRRLKHTKDSTANDKPNDYLHRQHVGDTSTPKKEHLDTLNIHQQHSEKDEEHSGAKIRRNLTKLIECDQNDYKMLNITHSDEPDLSPTFGINDDSSSSSSEYFYSDRSKREHNERIFPEAIKLEFSPTSISPPAATLADEATSNLIDQKSVREFSKKFTSKSFTRQKLNFEIFNDNLDILN